MAVTEEEKEIIKKLKNKKKQGKRERARETDDFDVLLGKYKEKVLKNIDKSKNGKGAAFEEVEMSDD